MAESQSLCGTHPQGRQGAVGGQPGWGAGHLPAGEPGGHAAGQRAGPAGDARRPGAGEAAGRGVGSKGPLPGRRHTQPRPPQLREKSQALEVSVAELVRQVKDLSDHFLALRWRLDLQEQTLSMRLQEASVPDRRGPASPATGLTALGPGGMGSTEWRAQQPPPRGSLSSFSNSSIEVQGTHQSTFSECEFRGSVCVLSCTSTTMLTSRTSPSPLKETPCVRRHSQPQASTDLLLVCGSARSRCFTKWDRTPCGLCECLSLSVARLGSIRAVHQHVSPFLGCDISPWTDHSLSICPLMGTELLPF